MAVGADRKHVLGVMVLDVGPAQNVMKLKRVGFQTKGAIVPYLFDK